MNWFWIVVIYLSMEIIILIGNVISLLAALLFSQMVLSLLA